MLSITGVDVVLSTVPSFAHHVVGTHTVEGNTGRPRRERRDEIDDDGKKSTWRQRGLTFVIEQSSTDTTAVPDDSHR